MCRTNDQTSGAPAPAVLSCRCSWTGCTSRRSGPASASANSRSSMARREQLPSKQRTRHAPLSAPSCSHASSHGGSIMTRTEVTENCMFWLRMLAGRAVGVGPRQLPQDSHGMRACEPRVLSSSAGRQIHTVAGVGRCAQGSQIRKRKMYEAFLAKVPVLATLDAWERLSVADALEPRTFAAGSVVMRQGDRGDDFYMIVEVRPPATR